MEEAEPVFGGGGFSIGAALPLALALALALARCGGSGTPREVAYARASFALDS